MAIIGSKYLLLFNLISGDTIMTYTETTRKLEKIGYKKHHSARTRGYISRKNDACKIENYKGKFGRGYKVLSAAWDSSQYCWVDYYVC